MVHIMSKRNMTASESIRFNMLMDKMGITDKQVYNTILDDFLESDLSFEILCKNPSLVL
jgi:predicted DNA-binding transcriptional regulator AlpA